MDEAKPYRLKPVSMAVKLQQDYNLTKALELAEHLEDEELARKLELKKSILVDANLLIYAVNRECRSA